MIQMMRFAKVEEGDAYPIDPMAVEDEWIVGEDPYKAATYVVHRVEPRFIAEYMICRPDHEEEQEILASMGDYRSTDVAFLSFQWIDPEPPVNPPAMDEGGDGEPGLGFWLESAEYAIKYSLGLPLDHLVQPEEDDDEEEVSAE